MKKVISTIVAFVLRFFGYCPKPEPLGDLSCLVVWNSWTNSRKGGGVVIGSRSILYTEHLCPPPGTRVRLASGDTGEIARIIPIGVPNAQDNGDTDVAIARLKEHLPDTVRAAVFAEPHARQPVWIVDQDGRKIATEIIATGATVRWRKKLRDMDSGSPVLVQKHGWVSLISLASRAQSGVNLSRHLYALASAITDAVSADLVQEWAAEGRR